MIKEITKKIHFIPYEAKKGRVKDTSSPPTVAVSTKYNTLLFSKKAIAEMGMAGKFVKLYFEPNRKILGWKIVDRLEQHQMKAWRLCKPAKIGTWSWSCKTILDQMRLKPDTSYPSLEVQRYREMGPLDEHAGEVFYFVEIKK